jgi:phytoene/squalene synthetase
MPKNKIRELLEQLQGELDQVDPQDEKGRKLLENITADIDSFLQKSDAQSDESILQRLQDTIDHFNIEHPKLTMALSEIMSILSNAGI